MSDATTQPLFEIKLDQPLRSKVERERQAFFRFLPKLLSTHGGQYVAVHDEQVVDSGADRLEVALRVLRRVGNVDIFVGLVSTQPEPISRTGVRRELGSRCLLV